MRSARFYSKVLLAHEATETVFQSRSVVLLLPFRSSGKLMNDWILPLNHSRVAGKGIDGARLGHLTSTTE